jgi:hypothetical protein
MCQLLHLLQLLQVLLFPPVAFVNFCPTALPGTLPQFLLRLLLMDLNIHYHTVIVLNTPFIKKCVVLVVLLLIVDGGANRGISGSDVVVLCKTTFTADVTGIANNTLQQVPVCTVAGVIQTQHGTSVGVFYQSAHHCTDNTNHSVSQLRHFCTIVDDTQRQFGGSQRLESLHGSITPFSIRCGLPYMDMSPPTHFELDTYPYMFFTADT